jgi:hypothetical protein
MLVLAIEFSRSVYGRATALPDNGTEEGPADSIETIEAEACEMETLEEVE